MSDDESDLCNDFNFQNATTISAKGPNTNITNLSFRPYRHAMSSTMFGRQRYAESSYDQRSMYYRRETSPMSVHSARDERPRNFQRYYSGMSSHRSVYNGRSGSPMSMRSIDSSASVSAADIAFAFKNVDFNKYQLRIIKDAYQKFIKQKVRRRIERRRNMRLFLKGKRRGSGYDSGEQGSSSSISSDDHRSVVTSYKENMSSNRLARIDFKGFKDCNMVKDCSEQFRQNSFRNKFSFGSNINQPFNISTASKQIIPTQKDRFSQRNGFLLPSQRFNQSIASSAIEENTGKPPRTQNNNMKNVKNHDSQSMNDNCPSASENEEIFSEITVREKSTYDVQSQGKRSLDSDDDIALPKNKKSRVASPVKNAANTKKAPSKPSIAACQENVEMSNSFQFAKPMLPVRKSRPKVQEKLIAKSHSTPLQPLNDFVEPIPQTQNNLPSPQPAKVQEKPNENVAKLDQTETSQISDVSSRPSFIKRKLYTQKMDVAEKANLSYDSATNSPQSSVYSLQKEKNKARKLVTNQSCLNREVQDENNLLDLIHKIVPPDQINITNQTTLNQTRMTDVNTVSKKDNDEKWDVTSVISMCNDDDVSDTFTDEEIFKADDRPDGQKNKNTNIKAEEKNTDKQVNSDRVIKECKIVLEKVQENNTLQKHVVTKNFNHMHNNVSKPIMKSAAQKFWDLDTDSEAECQTTFQPSNQFSNLKTAIATFNTTKQDCISSKGHNKNEISKKSQNVPEIQEHVNMTSMNNTVMSNPIDNMRKFNVSVRSHRTCKKKKSTHNITLTNEINSNLDYLRMFSREKKDSKTVEEKIENVDPKHKTPKKSSTHAPKPKLNKQTSKEKPATQNKKSPKENNKTANKDKKVTTEPNSTKDSKLKSKSETDKTSSSDKNKKLKQVESAPNIKATPKVSPKKKPKSKNDQQKNKNTESQSTKSNLSKTIETKLNTTVRNTRPIRSCRTPSQNRSIELSKSSLLNNTSIDGNKTLRSRVINLSSSIDNSIKIQPKNKRKNNTKNNSEMDRRQSDISFSLRSEKQIPASKKNLTRNRAEFFKGKT
ncbi:dual specificity protein kinase splB [Helicoverpa armigera]|uniref:dual specificity protein kinase splB n=1 Tax=Helicoverpa armigera TaxID=29058 RepID=UPI003083DBB8